MKTQFMHKICVFQSEKVIFVENIKLRTKINRFLLTSVKLKIGIYFFLYSAV